MAHQHHYDVLIIGSGASGLSLALQLAEHVRVAVLAKGSVQEGGNPIRAGGRIGGARRLRLRGVAR